MNKTLSLLDSAFFRALCLKHKVARISLASGWCYMCVEYIALIYSSLFRDSLMCNQDAIPRPTFLKLSLLIITILFSYLPHRKQGKKNNTIQKVTRKPYIETMGLMKYIRLLPSQLNHGYNNNNYYQKKGGYQLINPRAMKEKYIHV